MSSPVQADFSIIRYAQCWEDADILVEALQPMEGKRVLSIASAGDNTLALLSRGAEVTAIDMNPAQLACLELRVAAYHNLDHQELLGLIGSRPCDDRPVLYRRCRPELSDEARQFWDGREAEIRGGIGAAGKFERYFTLFRERILPLIHSRATVDRLLRGGDAAAQNRFYDTTWNTWRWRALFRMFFSRLVMGRLGRDPAFFQYVEGSVSDRILERTRHALTQLDCAANPYLQWILAGTHMTALPFALRPENFDPIRRNLHRLRWWKATLENVLAAPEKEKFDAYNLSNVFEYVAPEHFHRLMESLAASSSLGARLAYWNMLVPRSRPDALRDKVGALEELSARLFKQDKAFFYSRFVIEERIGA
jgi:S-adenosylmethionine-diacylglycerol 3-amino-3-carboxypropyl transferase